MRHTVNFVYSEVQKWHYSCCQCSYAIHRPVSMRIDFVVESEHQLQYRNEKLINFDIHHGQ